MSEPERFDIWTDAGGGRNWFVEPMDDGPFCRAEDCDQLREQLAKVTEERDDRDDMIFNMLVAAGAPSDLDQMERELAGFQKASHFIAALKEERDRLVEKQAVHRREIRSMQEAAEKRNRALTALHYVWCSGGCSHDAGPLTEDVVRDAIRNTERLAQKFQSIEFKELPVSDRFHYHEVVREGKELEAERDRLRKVGDALADANQSILDDPGAQWDFAPNQEMLGCHTCWEDMRKALLAWREAVGGGEEDSDGE